MKEGDIPGLSLIIVQDGKEIIKSYGFADVGKKKTVTSQTLFQIGSCTKAFTALCIVQLLEQHKIKLTDQISDYLPWFWATYKNVRKKITVEQLLHHTSGIPWNTISKIPQSNDEDALEKTVRQIVGQKLKYLPGEQYEYATVNYDVLALILQKVTGLVFEDYLQKNVLDYLGMVGSSVGKPKDSSLFSAGYKISFFKAIKYEAPIYKGNNAAGYVITNATDFAKWLKFQMGLTNREMYKLALATHQRDESVPLHDMSSYAMGWNISLSGNGEIYHDGFNPNYTAYVAFQPKKKLGVALLANSNSRLTPVLAENIMKLLAGEKPVKNFTPGDNNDKVFTLVYFIAGFYILLVAGLLVLTLTNVIKGKRKFERFSFLKFRKFAASLAFMTPFLFGIYIFPLAFAEFSWESIIVWAPQSFLAMITLLLVAIGATHLIHLVALFFPEKNKFKKDAPRILLLSLLSGIANMVVISIVTSALYTDVELKYIIFYYGLTLLVYLLGRKYVQTSLTRLNTELIYDLRIQLTDKIFSTSYQKFEKIDRGRIYTVLNDDISTLADSTNLVVVLFTSLFTAIGAFFYLASIELWATILTVALVIAISTIYHYVGKSTRRFFEEARDTQNTFLRLINGLIDGFKELSLHHRKKIEYKADIAVTANEFREKVATANIRFINAFLVGESLLIILLGVVSFGLPRIFPDIQFYTIMSFIIILLYLIGPVNEILNALPGIMRIRVAAKRIRLFLSDIPANMDMQKPCLPVQYSVESIKVLDVHYRYHSENELHTFSVGPLNLEVRTGEIMFLIGGNGSGKTTFAKLLTGLYEPDSGVILVNDKVVQGPQLSEYFSAVFSPAYLFEKLYNIDAEAKSIEIARHLKMLRLEEKVAVADNRYSTIELSGGQRKRLSLLQCYLEDSPIYLFDEWAADQDPEYRNFFYRTLLPEMRAAGKIIIVITHDEHYFDVADKLIKMNEGKLELYKDKSSDTMPEAHQEELSGELSLIQHHVSEGK